jgi:hypothetical protein
LGIKGRVAHLLQQIAFVPVQVHAVHEHCLASAAAVERDLSGHPRYLFLHKEAR